MNQPFPRPEHTGKIMSRPRTPATASDTFSDPGSLSDLESGWTDLSSNRSGGRLRTYSVNGDPSDEENTFEERLDEETWEGILHSDNEIDESTIVDERMFDSGCSPRSDSAPDSANLAPSTSPCTTEELVDCATSSQCSIRESRATLRLSFPDPLSDSREDIPPPHVTHAKFEQYSTQIDEASVAEHFAASSYTSPEEVANPEDKSTVCHHLEDGFTPRFAIILLGYSPLRYLKSSLLDFLLNAVANSLEGSPILSNDLQLSRTFRVPFQCKLDSGQFSSSPGHFIFISDCTNSLDVRPLGPLDLDCPTLVVVFLQPPNRYPQLPNLPANVKYLPILLHSITNDSISSLLDLTPSMLFDSSHSSIATPDHNSRHCEALRQCEELGILKQHVGGASAAAVLTVEQVIASSQNFSAQLTEAFFSEHQTREFINEIKEKYFGLSSKHIIVIFSILFSTALVLSNIICPTKMFSFYPDRHVSVQESLHPAHVSMAMSMAKTLGITAMRYETKSKNLVNPTTICRPHTHSIGMRSYPATLDPSPPVLTLDPPLVKALTLVPGKSIIRKLTVGAESITRKSDSLAIRLTSALVPFLDAMSGDLQELLDAIDTFLRAVRDLQGQIVREIGGIVDAIQEQTNQGLKDLSDKVSYAVYSLGELASFRHTRARNNARQARVAGEHLINAAKQRFEARWTRARSNARRAFDEGLLGGKMFFNFGQDGFQNAGDRKRDSLR